MSDKYNIISYYNKLLTMSFYNLFSLFRLSRPRWCGSRQHEIIAKSVSTFKRCSTMCTIVINVCTHSVIIDHKCINTNIQDQWYYVVKYGNCCSITSAENEQVSSVVTARQRRVVPSGGRFRYVVRNIDASHETFRFFFKISASYTAGDH